jgi:hypothetical protein
VVGAGAVISALAIVLAYVILPFSRSWSDREAAIDAKTEQVARLQALLESQGPLQERADALERIRDQRARRLLTGSTPALAASSLQMLIRDYAGRSRVRLERVDVDRDMEAGEQGLTPVALQLTARGDIYGLVDFVFHLQSGEKVLAIDELRVSAGAGGRIRGGAELLAWTIRLHGLYAPGEAAA